MLLPSAAPTTRARRGQGDVDERRDDEVAVEAVHPGAQVDEGGHGRHRVGDA